MSRTPPEPRNARVTWRSVMDHGVVAAAFLTILWFLMAGLLPDHHAKFETASAGSVTIDAAPVAAKAP